MWTPVHPTVDVDANANFTLPAAPTSSLLVTYGWQFYSDADVDGFVDEAREWLREYTDVTLVPDGLAPALIPYAGAIALRGLARKCTLADTRAGDAAVNFSALAKAYSADADKLEKEALAARQSYYSRADEALAPAASATGLSIDPFQPRR